MVAPTGYLHSPSGMTLDRDVESRPAAWIRWTTWTAILAPLPYTLSRVLWALGIPLGIDADVLHDELHAPGLGSLFILLLGVAAELTALWTRAFLLMRPSRYPRWLPILRNRPVQPRLVIAPLLLPILILAAANAMSATWIADGFRRAPGHGVQRRRLGRHGCRRRVLDLGREPHGRDRRVLAGRAPSSVIGPHRLAEVPRRAP